MTTGNCAFLFLTESCNLRCRHCYVSAEPHVGAEMPFNVVERALQVLMGLEIRDIRLTGGEATVHSGFRDIVSYIHAAGCRVGLVTNGVRILKEEAEPWLWEKLSRCWVSLYGVTAKTHGATSRRSEASFQTTIMRVGDLSRRGYWIGLSVLLSPGEGRDVEALVQSAGAAGVRRLRFIPLQPDGRARADASIDWAGWPEEISRVATSLKSIGGDGFDVLTLNDPFDLYEQFGAHGDSCLLHTRQMWTVVPNGEVYPCCFTVGSPGMRIGNIMSPTIDGELSRRVSLGAHRADCRGLSPQFWPEIVRRSASCPIRSVDPRHAPARS